MFWIIVKGVRYSQLFKTEKLQRRLDLCVSDRITYKRAIFQLYSVIIECSMYVS